MIRSILVARNNQSHLGNSPSLFTGVRQGGFFKWLFCFQRLVIKRGHDLPLENVDATDSDKRGERGVYLLRKLGIVKTLEAFSLNLDKREHLTLVDNLGTTSLIVPSIRSLKAWRNEKTTCKF